MIKYIIVLWALVAPYISHCQVYKYKTTQHASILKDKNEEFVSASDWMIIHVLVMVKIKSAKVNIYDTESKEYDIIDIEDPWADEYNNSWLRMHCIDVNGNKCCIRQCKLKNPTQEYQYILYVDYLNFTEVYKMTNDE